MSGRMRVEILMFPRVADCASAKNSGQRVANNRSSGSIRKGRWHMFCQRVLHGLVSVVVMSAFVGSAAAGGWQVTYQTDFSSDPGWVTNNSDRYYWDSSNEEYYANMVNVNNGGYYAVHDVGHDGTSFRLEWDMILRGVGYAAGLRFGMFDSDHRSQPDGSTAHLTFYREDRGLLLGLESYYWAGDAGSDQSYPIQFSLDTWYRVMMEYDDSAHTLTAEIDERDGGQQHLVSLSIDNAGPFSADMRFLGSSNVRDGGFQVPGAEGLGGFDNVVFSIPEPTTLSLLVLGGLAVLTRRRK